MVQAAVHQCHQAGAEFAAQLAGQLQAARSTTYDHDFAMQTTSHGLPVKTAQCVAADAY
ncbi:hypothetical protein GJA_2929 [Janthinobacterium agaricidamnosum NBRC 102515 = DSM 9628]|uniref:Uncharacterized protein n=1 Tax=Janthinobacterium agaricidamnosum NBRC 102515 = DSM 9628 TaxID=1349767 RepID=W0V7J2_9BURK|nr:hypothetical protein GJA_2929 [Janthinobacterium agaricidamnosum NBRC 102515 = DSM 9628]